MWHTSNCTANKSTNGDLSPCPLPEVISPDERELSSAEAVELTSADDVEATSCDNPDVTSLLVVMEDAVELESLSICSRHHQ